MTTPPEPPSALLLRLVNGYQVSQAIHVAAALKLADFVDDRPIAVSELSTRVGAHTDSLYRLLRALSSVGVFRETEGRCFAATPMSELLRTDHPQSISGWARFIGRPYHWQMWGDLLHSVQTGQDAIHHRYGVDIWTYRAEKPEETAVFNAAMAALSKNVATAIVTAGRFTRFHRIVDVGGADGALLTAILTACPRSTGVVFDLPHVVRAAVAAVTAAELEGRCEIVEGSYFDTVPAGGDAYIIKSVLMDHTDETCVDILRRVRTVMHPEGRVLVIESLVTAQNDSPRTAFSDLMMLVATGGRERARDEWEAILAAAGLALDAITPTASRFQILEARAAV
jgi:hypothetical protein